MKLANLCMRSVPWSARLCLALVLFPVAGSALQIEPWFGNIYEFDLSLFYQYSRFDKVQSAKPQIKHPFNDHLFGFDLGMPLSDSFAVDLDLEIVDTPIQTWGYRSTGLQGRYLWMNDVEGDPVSFTTGLDIRQVSTDGLRDVSCPYHSQFDAQLTTAIGKEWSRGEFWKYRTFFFGAFGMANRGSPWARALLSFQGNICNRHQYRLFADSYWGFGNRHTVNTSDFDGYAKIHHQSIDLGIGYKFLSTYNGSLSLDYAYRVYAHSFPERASFITLTYEIPFSLF
jgi:hypothetical protein